MRKTVLTAAWLCLVSIAGILTGSQVMAERWKVCNASAEDIEVAIAYPVSDARQYISKGWWTLRSCGGCKTVYNGPLPTKGVFLRGEGAKGALWEGEYSFCASESRFELPNGRGSRNCPGGQKRRDFALHNIKSQNFTTTLRNTRPGSARCID